MSNQNLAEVVDARVGKVFTEAEQAIGAVSGKAHDVAAGRLAEAKERAGTAVRGHADAFAEADRRQAEGMAKAGEAQAAAAQARQEADAKLAEAREHAAAEEQRRLDAWAEGQR